MVIKHTIQDTANLWIELYLKKNFFYELLLKILLNQKLSIRKSTEKINHYFAYYLTDCMVIIVWTEFHAYHQSDWVLRIPGYLSEFAPPFPVLLISFIECSFPFGHTPRRWFIIPSQTNKSCLKAENHMNWMVNQQVHWYILLWYIVQTTEVL